MKRAFFQYGSGFFLLGWFLLTVPATYAQNGREAGTVTIVAVGDIMLGTTYPTSSRLAPDDGRNLLVPVTPALRRPGNDIVFGNLEGPLCDKGSTGKSGPNSFAFRVPTRYGAYLKRAGFTVLNMANNHSGDFGASGRQTTRQTLDKLGIWHTGMVGDVAHVTVRGRRVAVIGFAPNNGCHNLNDIAGAKRLVARLASGGELVVVSFHGGGEGSGRQHVLRGAEMYMGENRGDLRRFAHAVVDSGAALVIGHGPHVWRGMEVYRGHLIAYSLGNFATYGMFGLRGPTATTGILTVRLRADGTFAGGNIVSAYQPYPGGPLPDKERRVIAIVRALSRADFGAGAATVRPDGTIAPALPNSVAQVAPARVTGR